MVRWLSKLRLAAVGAILTALASCGGNPAGCDACAVEDFVFYRSTWLSADSGGVTVNAGEEASALVTVGWDEGLALTYTVDRSFTGVFIVPPTAGVTLSPTTDACVILPGVSPLGGRCKTFRLRVSADAIAAGVRQVTLSAIWGRGSPPSPLDPRTIERVETFSVSLAVPPPVVVPDFAVSVAAAASAIYGTRATLPVTITRTGGFAEPVTLEFDGLTSGVRGSFAVEPMATDLRSLELQIPARYAGGGRVDLQVTARAPGGLTKIVNFSPYIEPLFKLILQPQSATLTTAAPLQVDLGLKAGELFRTPSIGAVELSISPLTSLPPGVSARFLGDAMPVVPVLPVQTVTQVLQLVTDGRPPGVMGPLQIRGTARGVPPDYDGVAPFIEVTLDLTVAEGQFWQFAGNNLTYGTREADLIGMALQSDNRPAFAWIEGSGSSKRVYMRRFDGTNFGPSPPRVDLGSGPFEPSLSGSGSSVAEASFALTATDAGQVAFTYDGGARLALGRADRASVEWRITPPLVVGDPADPATTRARSPRVVTGPNADAVVVSYIREANASTTTGGVLHVLQTFGNGVLSMLPTSLPGGALNASPVGSVVRHSNALALHADGNPWVAWVEQPTNGTNARLWLRAYDGNDWSAAREVPTTGTPVGASVQLLVEPSGQVVVAWVEGSPAQLKLTRYDPSGQTWTPLDNTGNGRGSLNVTALSPALDVHLAREPGAQGRLLVAWTEGGADPRVWIKRLGDDGVWRLVGTTVSQVDRWSKTPRIVSDGNRWLYVAWATYAAGQNPATSRPYAEIDVAQWVFP